MFTDLKKPFAKPPLLKCKAAEARHLIPALATVARKRMQANNEVSVHIAGALANLSLFYITIDSGDVFLSLSLIHI